MDAIILFLVGFMLLGGYNRHMDIEDKVYPVYTSQYDVDIDVRTTPGVIEEGETVLIPGPDGKLSTCTLRGGQLFCTDVWI